MGDLILAINEDDLSTLSLEVLDYADRISEIFDKIDEAMDQLSNHYQGLPAVEIMNHYKELAAYYTIFKENIVTYSDDFVELIKKMREMDKDVTKMVQGFTEDTIKKAKVVEYKGGN